MYNTSKQKACYLCYEKLSDDNDIRCSHCLAWQPPESGVSLSISEAQAKEQEEGQKLDEDGTVLLCNVTESKHYKFQTGPWDPCFGGTKDPGIVVTGVYMLGGSPGAGKSTMTLQLCNAIIEATEREILYVGAEEALEEIKARAKRIDIKRFDKFRLVPLGVSVNLPEVMQARRPAITVIDSIQKWSDDPEEQVKICESLKAFAVELKCPVLVISQVTKADDFAGLNKLKHTVDCLIMLTCDDDEVRILQSEKNRYGDTAGVLFDMTEKGLILRIEDEDEDEEGEFDDE